MLRFLLRLKAYWLILWNAGLPDLTQEAYPPDSRGPRIRPGRDRGEADLRNVSVEYFIKIADGCIKKTGQYIPEPLRTEVCTAVGIDLYTQFVERLRPILAAGIDIGYGNTLEVKWQVHVEAWMGTTYEYHGSESNCDC